MTQHIDIYSPKSSGFSATWDNARVRRLSEGQEAIDYATTGPGFSNGLPYFNGYALLTALHDDGECQNHKPSGRVWEPIIQPWEAR